MKALTTNGLTELISLIKSTYIPNTDTEQTSEVDVVNATTVGVDATPTASSTNLVTSGGVASALSGKQDTLVSGTNIKTINNQSVLGSGNISITASATWGNITGTLSDQTDLQTALNGKQATLSAGSNISISGTTISATNTTYTGSDGITLTGTNFTNSGVRSIATGSTNGTISVNTNGTSADVAVYGLGSAAYTASSDYATAAQGALADTAVQPGDLATVATTGDYGDLLNKPTIPAAQVNSDWNANSGVAEILNKPTTLAGYGITDGANKDLSNLTDTGANIANWSSNVSNCITEIPQDIKLELNAGALTLKAGSKVYVPNGVGTFDEVTIASDLTKTQATNETDMFFVTADGTVVTWSTNSNIVSGPTYNGGGIGVWYDTTNNRIRYTTDSGSTWSNNLSFPVCIYTVSGGAITSIDQVFNGFGYIGSTVFALPGIKGVIPNGRNTDGTLNNTSFITSSVLTQLWPLTSCTGIRLKSNELTMGDLTYDKNDNYNRSPSDGSVQNYCLIGCAGCNNSSITMFFTKTVFHAVDYDDVANLAMPSSKYVNLTVGATGSTYVAPADGYIHFGGRSTSQYGNIGMNSKSGNVGLAYFNNYCQYPNNYMHITIPVSKGQTVEISYFDTDTLGLRFIYANGAQ